MSSVEFVEILHTIIVPLFICALIWRTDMQEFRAFIDALHCPGASVLVGYILVVTGIVMMKIMLMDDGKYIIGSGAGILAKSLAGSATPPSATATSTATTTNTTPDPPKPTLEVKE